VSINGANRLGSNSLTELLVFGARAGRAAANFASEQAVPTSAILNQALDEERRLIGLLRKDGGEERIAALRQELQHAMEQGAGIYRDHAGLQAAADQIQQLRKRFDRVGLQDRSRTFNTEWVAYLELSNLIDLAETIIQSGLERQESRGAHQRTDHPERDDSRFLAHSLAYRRADRPPRIEYLPVTITRWPPAERVYGS